MVLRLRRRSVSTNPARDRLTVELPARGSRGAAAADRRTRPRGAPRPPARRIGCRCSSSTRRACASASSRRSPGATSTRRDRGGASRKPSRRRVGHGGCAVPAPLFAAVLELVPRDDRTPGAAGVPGRHRRSPPDRDRAGVHRRWRTGVLAARSPTPADLARAPSRPAVGPHRRARRAAQPRRNREHVHARARRRDRDRLRGGVARTDLGPWPSGSPPTYEEALERISELEEELESLDALLLLRERAAATTASGTISTTSRGSSVLKTCSNLTPTQAESRASVSTAQ